SNNGSCSPTRAHSALGRSHGADRFETLSDLYEGRSRNIPETLSDRHAKGRARVSDWFRRERNRWLDPGEDRRARRAANGLTARSQWPTGVILAASGIPGALLAALLLFLGLVSILLPTYNF